jgi:YidC/Oxa1 family membrane protein insertase
MDRKHQALGLLFLVGALGAFYWSAQETAAYQAAQAKAVPAAPAPAAVPAVAPVAVPAAPTPGPVPALAPDAAFQPAVVAELANAHLRLRLTSHGGGILDAALLNHPVALGDATPFRFNSGSPDPALEIHIPDPATAKPVAVRLALSPAASSDGWTRYQGALPDGTKVVRAYRLRADAAATGAADPHGIEFTVTLTPPAGRAAPKFWLSTGAWQPEAADTTNLFQTVLVSDGEDTEHVSLSEFTDSAGFLGFFAHKASAEYPLVAAGGGVHRWVAAANQYFVASLCPEPAQRGARSEVVALPVALEGGQRAVRALASWEGVVGADGSRTLSGTFYVGPKHYSRLAALPEGQVDSLQFVKLFGFIGIAWMAKLLLSLLGGVHWLLTLGGALSWGWSILLLTLIIKLLTWPLTSAQLKASKKMAQFAKPMQELREKHKKNPEKMQKELMKLYQENGINPLAGCLPILIQIPIFFGLYTAFQTAPEMRLEGFLWIADLAKADTVAHLGPIPLNPLPLLMGATMWYSMRMTPMPNQDETMKTVMTVMMLMFPLICYTMPAALTLYWTFQNVLQIAQTWLLKRAEAGAPAKA